MYQDHIASEAASIPGAPPGYDGEAFDYDGYIKDRDRRIKAREQTQLRCVAKFCRQEQLLTLCAFDMLVLFGALRLLAEQLGDKAFLARARRCGRDLQELSASSDRNDPASSRTGPDIETGGTPTLGAASASSASDPDPSPRKSDSSDNISTASYNPAAIAQFAEGVALRDVPADMLERSLMELIAAEGPIAQQLILDSVRRGYDMTAIRGSTREHVIEALDGLVAIGSIEEQDGEKTYVVPDAHIRVRNRKGSNPLVRIITHVPMSEMRVAVCDYLGRSNGATLAQTQRTVARALGLSLVSGPLAQRLEVAMRPLMGSGDVAYIDGLLHLRTPRAVSASQASGLEIGDVGRKEAETVFQTAYQAKGDPSPSRSNVSDASP